MASHIDLFAGIGGFSLGFERAGIETVAHVEIDKHCQKLLHNHWPEHLILADVRDVGAHNLPQADIITFGSPCQDLSVAGRRAGIEGGRSGLFFEAVRIIRELNPRYAVWENVPGALSSGGGRDFQAVIESLLDASVPMPKSGRWAGAGMVRAGQKELAWIIKDAQYFGVAQRRRRVFVVLSTGGRSASSILFESNGMSGGTAESREAGEGFASCSPSGFGGYSARLTVGALQARDGKGIGSTIDDKIVLAPTPDASNNISGSKKSQEITRRAETAVDMQIWEMQHTDDTYRESGDVAPTLQSRMGTGGNQVPLVGLRKLTPTECERLQGFPDGWSDGFADSTRYKMLGNAVAVPVAEWIGRRIMEAL